MSSHTNGTEPDLQDWYRIASSYAERLWRSAANTGRKLRMDPQDYVQEVILTFIRNLESQSIKTNPPAYLRTMIRNRMADDLRKKGGQEFTGLLYDEDHFCLQPECSPEGIRRFEGSYDACTTLNSLTSSLIDKPTLVLRAINALQADVNCREDTANLCLILGMSAAAVRKNFERACKAARTKPTIAHNGPTATRTVVPQVYECGCGGSFYPPYAKEGIENDHEWCDRSNWLQVPICETRQNLHVPITNRIGEYLDEWRYSMVEPPDEEVTSPMPPRVGHIQSLFARAICDLDKGVQIFSNSRSDNLLCDWAVRLVFLSASTFRILRANTFRFRALVNVAALLACCGDRDDLWDRREVVSLAEDMLMSGEAIQHCLPYNETYSEEIQMAKSGLSF